MKFVIIGGVAAGMSAASKARRTDPSMEITVYTKENEVSYAGCGLPYFIGGTVSGRDSLIARTAEAFSEQGIVVMTGHEVTGIMPEKKEISVKNGNSRFRVPYDKLLIATGADPRIPDIAGNGLPGVFTLKSIPDAERIISYLTGGNVHSAVIIGGGFIGLELVETFRRREVCRITVIEGADHVMNQMDDDMAFLIEEYLAAEGVEVRLGEKVLGLEEEDGHVSGAVTESGVCPADIVVLAAGFSPNSQLALEAGIKLGAGGAIKVNARMETNIRDIYSAGDCAVAYNEVFGEDVYHPMGTTANKQGRIAGFNAAGGKEEFSGVAGTAIMKLLDIEVSQTGFTEKKAKAYGRDYAAVRIKARVKAHYYPDAGFIHIKLLADRGTRVLLGAQIVGSAGAAKKIDVLSLAVKEMVTVDRLARGDFAYSPAFAPVWDSILTAANRLVDELDGKNR